MHTRPYTYSIINNQYRKYSTLCLTSLKKGRCFWVLIQCQYRTPCPDIQVFHFKCEITHLIILRKTRRVSVFTWLYKAWLWFLLISRWLDASFTNHSNCAFLSGKVFITSRAKANRAVSSIWGRLHRRHWLAAGTACIIWKTGINKCLMRRRKSMAKRSRAHVLCLWDLGWCLRMTLLLFSIFWPILLTKKIAAIMEHILRQNLLSFLDHKYFCNFHIENA